MYPKFFSVRNITYIGIEKLVPHVCYKTVNFTNSSIAEMIEKNVIEFYETEVVFFSGVPIPVKREKPVKEVKDDPYKFIRLPPTVKEF